MLDALHLFPCFLATHLEMYHFFHTHKQSPLAQPAKQPFLYI